MRILLKVVALPVLLVMKIFCWIGNLLTNLSSYAIGLLLLVIAGCGIYCVVQRQWTNLAILVCMGLCVFLILFAVVALVFKVESWSNRLQKFIHS